MLDMYMPSGINLPSPNLAKNPSLNSKSRNPDLSQTAKCDNQ